MRIRLIAFGKTQTNAFHMIDLGHVFAALADFMKENARMMGPALLKHEVAALMRLLVKSGYRLDPY